MVLNRYSNIFLSVALITVIVTVALYSKNNYNDFLENNQQLADRSVEGTSREIEFFINEKKRYVNLFSEQERILLTNLTYSPHNETAHQILEDKINVYFPNRFAFTLANQKGNPLLVQGKDLIGKACRDDISLFSSGTNQNTIYVHPSPKTSRQHYDVMTSIKTEAGSPSVLFVSFFLDDILRIIKNAAINQHHLFLLKRGSPTVVEVTTPKALDIFRRHGHTFELTPSVKANEFRYIWPESLNNITVARESVSGTHWQLVDVIEPDVMDTYFTRMIYQAVGILLLFAIITLAGFWLTKRLGILSGDTNTILNSVEKERQRVAMDLHDQVLSDISHLRRDYRTRNDSSNSDSNNSSNSSSNSSNSSNTTINIDEGLEQITNTIRHIIDDLHPQSIEILGLAETIRSYCKKHYQQLDMQVNIFVEKWHENRLNQTEKLNIFRIFQEAIHNASKHSDASQCDVKLQMTTHKLLLSVTDNGIGMPADIVNNTGKRGMANITSRARIIHAKPEWSKSVNGTVFSLILVLR